VWWLALSYFQILRTAFACYRFSDDFDPNEFQKFVEDIDGELMQSSAEMLEDFKHELDKVNCPEGIEANFSRAFLVMEYARQRLSNVSKLGLLDALLSADPPNN
jgi:hypothetical protein